MSHLHVIPVDPSLTTQQAWEELRLMHKRITYTGQETWTAIECDGHECSEIEEET